MWTAATILWGCEQDCRIVDYQMSIVDFRKRGKGERDRGENSATVFPCPLRLFFKWSYVQKREKRMIAIFWSRFCRNRLGCNRRLRNSLIRFSVCLMLSSIGSSCSEEKSVQPGSSPAARVSSAPPPMAASHQPTGGSDKSLGPLKLSVPAGWIEQAPSSSMRKAQFVLPRASGDGEDGELVVFYFGAGQGGSVEANIERWVGQFGHSVGSSSKDKAKTNKSEAGGMPVTFVDVTGTYQAPIMPGAPERHNSPGYRLLAAVVETSEGPWFFKLVGPEKTIAKWSQSFDQFIKSIRRA